MTAKTRLKGFREGSAVSAMAPALAPDGVARWHSIPTDRPDKLARNIRYGAHRRGYHVAVHKRGDHLLIRARRPRGDYTPQELLSMDRPTLDSILVDLGVAPDETVSDHDTRGLILAMSERQEKSNGNDEDRESGSGDGPGED